MRTYTFAEASAYRLSFGKYNGKSVDEIASTDEGLLWLDWFSGEVDKAGPSIALPAIAIRTYLADPTIAGDVERLVRERR